MRHRNRAVPRRGAGGTAGDARPGCLLVAVADGVLTSLLVSAREVQPDGQAANPLAADVASPSAPPTAADGRESIEVHIATVRNLFDSLDPAPFRERDLDPKVEQYIVGWAREVPPRRPLELVVHLDRPSSDDADVLQRAVREYFQQRAVVERRAMRHMLHIGRVSLAIGIAVLAAAMVLGDLLSALVGRYAYGEIIAHSLLIGGWVALWRPLEIFLYDWWPIRADARLYDRLSAMPVRVVCTSRG